MQISNKMKLKSAIQIFLFITIIAIIIIFYYQFISNNKPIQLDSEKINNANLSINKDFDSELINIEYNSFDDNGNSYYIFAEKAVDESNKENNEIIKLFGVISIITLKDKGIINITAKKANYNRINNNTSFFDNVRIDFLDKKMNSDNLDMFFTEKKSIIYNNVVFKDENFQLKTDEVFINLVTGDVNLSMKNEKDKVKLTAKNEYIN